MKPKFNQDSELWIRVLEGQYVDEFQQIHNETKWIKVEDDIDLGSVKNPKTFQGKKILEIKYKVPSELKSNIFRGFGFFK